MSDSSQDVADAVVIGAGVIGCSVARALAKAGRSVLVVDRLGGPGLGSTSGSSAIIRFNYSTLAGVGTSWESHYAWEDWAEFLGGPDDDGGAARFWRTGSVCLNHPDDHAERVLSLFDQVGVPYERLDAAALRDRFGWLDPASHYPPKPVTSEEFWDDPAGEVNAFYTPDSGFVDDPSYAAHNLATAAARAGATFRFRTEVTAIETSGDRVSGVRLSDGSRVSTPIVVNVAGPHSGRVNEIAGVGDDFGVSTRPLRVEVHHVPAPPGHSEGHPGPLVADLDLGTYFRGTPTGDLTIGGTEPECDELHWLDSPEGWSEHVTQELYETQVYRAARRMPELTVPNQPRGIAAVYDVADDWIPIYDRTSLPGFYVAIGTSGNQFKNSPLVGDYVRTIIDACENGQDHDTEPATYDLPRSGVTVDLSAYSRLRRPTPGSSNSVMG